MWPLLGPKQTASSGKMNKENKIAFLPSFSVQNNQKCMLAQVELEINKWKVYTVLFFSHLFWICAGHQISIWDKLPHLFSYVHVKIESMPAPWNMQAL